MVVNAFFIIAAILIGLMIFRGYRKGILGLVVGVVSWIFLFIFVQWATPQIYLGMKTSDSFSEDISEKVSEKLKEKADEITLDNVGDDETKSSLMSIKDFLPEGTTEQYEELLAGLEQYRGLMDTMEDEDLKSQISQEADRVLEEKKQEAIVAATEILTDYILRGLAGLIALIIGLLVVSIADGLVRLLNHTPVIGNFSRIAGVLFGLLEGVLLVWILMYAVTLFSATDFGADALSQVKENVFLSYLYDNNILMVLFQ